MKATSKNNVARIFPGPVNGLINWMEQNFHDIDQFVVTFAMKDGSTMTVYDVFSYLDALGISAISTDCIQKMAADDQFVTKER